MKSNEYRCRVTLTPGKLKVVIQLQKKNYKVVFNGKGVKCGRKVSEKVIT